MGRACRDLQSDAINAVMLNHRRKQVTADGEHRPHIIAGVRGPRTKPPACL